MTRIVIAAAPQAPAGSISLSASHADIGDQLTITGSGFGASRGTNHVYFGEPLNHLGFRPVTREAASYVSWSDSSIVVTVPSMSPGKAGATGTYHNVRVEIDGVDTDPASFYIDPVSTNPAITGATWNSGTSTYSNSSAYGIWPQDNFNDVLFDGCTFTATNGTISGDEYGCVTLGQGNRWHQRITFLNCTITSNTQAGDGGGDGGVNGVKVIHGYAGYRCSDLSFVGCNFGTLDSGYGHSRMGYEQVGEAAYPADNVLFRDCVFEPAGSECISNNGGSLYQLVDNCTFRGAGMYVGSDWIGAHFESNTGLRIELRNCHFWSARVGAFNCNGNTTCYILATGCDIDMSHHYQSRDIASDAHIFRLGTMDGFHFLDGAIITGDLTHFAGDCGDADAGWTSWYHTTDADFSGSVVSGYVLYGSPNWPTPHIPTSIIGGYWQAATNVNNTWPTIDNA